MGLASVQHHPRHMTGRSTRNVFNMVARRHECVMSLRCAFAWRIRLQPLAPRRKQASPHEHSSRGMNFQHFVRLSFRRPNTMVEPNIYMAAAGSTPAPPHVSHEDVRRQLPLWPPINYLRLQDHSWAAKFSMLSRGRDLGRPTGWSLPLLGAPGTKLISVQHRLSAEHTNS